MTTPVDKPIIVPTTALPAASLALLRCALTALGGVFISRGWLSEAELNEIVGLVLIVVPAVWGIVSARRNVARQQAMVGFAPDEIAVAATDVPKILS